MKKQLISCFLLSFFFVQISIAQIDFSSEPAAVELIELNADISNINEYFSLKSTIINGGEDTLNVMWRHQIAENCPDAWRLIFSDQNLDYMLSETAGSTFPNILTQSNPSYETQATFAPRQIPGCCDLRIEYFLENEPDVVIGTADFFFQVNDTNCSTTATYDVNQEKFRIFPVPADNFLNIDANIDFENLIIYNSQGQFVKQFSGNMLSRYDVSDVSAGVFILVFVTADGEIFTQKVVKR